MTRLIGMTWCRMGRLWVGSHRRRLDYAGLPMCEHFCSLVLTCNSHPRSPTCDTRYSINQHGKISSRLRSHHHTSVPTHSLYLSKISLQLQRGM